MKPESLPAWPVHAIDGNGAGATDPDGDSLLADIRRLARRVFDCPTVTVSLVRSTDPADWDENGDQPGNPHRLSGVAGQFALDVFVTETPVVVANAQEDPRYARTFLVTAYPFVRFYAGAPLVVHGTMVTGVLSIFDYQPRPDFGEDEQALLTRIARLASGEIERHSLQRLSVLEAAQRERLAADSRAALVEIARDGRIANANDAMERLTGTSRLTLIGAPVARFIPDTDALERRVHRFLEYSEDPLPGLDGAMTVHASGGLTRRVHAYPACTVDGSGLASLHLVLVPVSPEPT